MSFLDKAKNALKNVDKNQVNEGLEKAQEHVKNDKLNQGIDKVQEYLGKDDNQGQA